MIEATQVRQLFEELEAAQQQCRPIAAFSDRMAELDLKDGYKVQSFGLESRLSRGHRLAGYKMGLTSRAKQVDVGVSEPIRGYLLADGELADGEPLARERYVHPRAEPEIAVRLGRALSGEEVSLRDVAFAVDSILFAMEILDSRFQAFKFRAPDVVADNTSAAAFVLGRPRRLTEDSDWLLSGVCLRRNGEILDTGVPSAVLGHPFAAVAALARSLAREGRGLEPGQIVLTGGITASVPLMPGMVLEAGWRGETLSLRVA